MYSEFYEEMNRMFGGKFWTRDEELKEDVENNGIEVLDMNYEGICVWDADEENEVYIRLSRANTTVWMAF